MQTLSLRFVRDKETKNTVRFAEETAAGSEPIVGQLYVKKGLAGDVQRLRVTVEAA